MLIQPSDVANYSTSTAVKNRGENQLTMDILQAETKLFQLTGREENDPEFSPLPEKVKVFLIKYSEFYAMLADYTEKGYKTETHDDYSYTKFENAKLKEPDLLFLIKDYIKTDAKSGKAVIFRMRAI